MQIEINEVHTFKFNSGEEVIAKVTAFEHPWITVNEPVAVAPGPQGMGLVPSMFTADPAQNPTLNMNSVALYSLTDDAVCMKYLEATTGIRVPEKKIIMG